jgi:hypothetical protein
MLGSPAGAGLTGGVDPALTQPKRAISLGEGVRLRSGFIVKKVKASSRDSD